MLNKFISIFANKEYQNIDYCKSCGACCSYFRVIFDLDKNKQVPKEYIFKYDNNEVAMKGAEIIFGRCDALSGEVGKSCSCEIYANRPDVCKKFSIWNKDGSQNSDCIMAREYHNLPGLVDVKN